MTRELPLNPLWESLGATLKVEQDWRIPSIFKDFLSEYTAVRKKAGILDHSFRGKIEVTGKDRVTFLHNILSNDIKGLSLANGCYATLLSATGKILASMNVYAFANSILLDTEMGFEKKLLDLLSKYLITEDVKLTDVTGEYALVSLQGPRAEALAQALFPGPFPELVEFQQATFHIGNANVTLIRESRTGENGYHLLIPKDDAARVVDRVLVVGKLYGLQPVGFGTSEILRIEAGILRYGVDVDENISLPETGLDDVAASATKGCYPGQEVVARTKTYGGLNRKIVGLLFSKGVVPAMGDKIYGAVGNSEKEIGWITSACVSPSLDKGIAMGLIQKGFFDKKTAVRIKRGSGEIPATTTDLPFYRKLN